MTTPAPKGVLLLPERLDYAAATTLTQDLIARRGGDLALDAKAVTEIGLSCAQALLAAARAWRADARTLRLANLSDDVAAQLRLLGLDPATLSAP